MATIAVYSVKGGVGKTTLAANMAWCAAHHSRRQTLLWDLDAAGGGGYLLGVDADTRRSAQKVIARERDPAKVIRQTQWKRLDVLPADESIRLLDRQFGQLGKRKQLAKIAGELLKTYERIVFDCPPVLNEVSQQVMRAADLVIVPLPPSPLCTRAFDLVADEVRAAGGKNHPPILPVLSMIDLRRSLHKEAREAAPDWPLIPAASAIEQCAVRREPVGAFAPSSAGAKAFAGLWTAIERKLAAKRA